MKSINRSGVRRLSWTLAFTSAAAVAVALACTRDEARAAPDTSPPAIPVTVAAVVSRTASAWNAYSGRIEAVERVDVRARVAGPILKAHFREGSVVHKGDVLFTIDPEPFAAQVERARAQLSLAQEHATWATSEFERSQRLIGDASIAQREFDAASNVRNEAKARVRSAQADLTLATLDLGYTQVRAPVSGRAGRIEVTVGNLVSAGPTAPILTSIVSTDPIYARFDADERTVAEALAILDAQPGDRRGRVEEIPVRVGTSGRALSSEAGHLQLIDNRVDARSGTVRVRAQLSNPDGRLMDGQFAQIELGSPQARPLLLIDERAVATDQAKRYVFVVDANDTVIWREVRLGGVVDGLRVVNQGLAPGDRVVVDGLQRVRSGSRVAPTAVPMSRAASQAS